jgi:hypothetical protein
MKTIPSFSKTIATAAVALLPALTFGFAGTGHQLVALVAEHDLTTRTREIIHQILPNETLPEVASWADEERRFDRSTSTWHYIDYNIRTGRVEPDHAAEPTILDALSSNTAALRNAESSVTRQRALKFVTHFVADLHQPLHCSDDNDSGGNKVTVKYKGHEERLHHLWDQTVVEEMMARNYPGKTVPQVADAIYQKYAPKRDLLTSGTAEAWSRESFECARGHAYKLPPAEAGKARELDENYMAKSAQIIEEQIARAGFRLAHVLNSLLDPSYGKPFTVWDHAPAQTRPQASRPAHRQVPVPAGAASD